MPECSDPDAPGGDTAAAKAALADGKGDAGPLAPLLPDCELAVCTDRPSAAMRSRLHATFIAGALFWSWKV